MPRLWFAALLFAVLLPCESIAEPRQPGPYFSLMGSYIGADDDRNVKSEIAGGQMGLGYAFGSNWNVELYSQFAGLSGTPDQDLTSFGVDIQQVFRRDATFRPYLFIGGGLLQNDVAGVDKKSGGMLDLGAGFRAHLFGNGPFSVRGEYRYRADSALDSTLKDSIVSLGVELAFGPSRRPEVVRDGDGDGVVDDDDRCPGTPPGTAVNPLGCALDSDRDGVPDSFDECPNTPAGTPVDSVGCERDSDGDGVVDQLDRCPGTPPNTAVDVYGCEIKAEIKLPGVNFGTDSAILLPGAERVLGDAIATLQKNPSIIVEVAGHTDNVGRAEYNEHLSERRAQTVGQYLISGGIDPGRVFAQGYGEAVPIADNATADGRSRNRRVVLRILRE